MNLIKIEKELKKRLPYNYSWGRKQNDEWDKITNFIYRINEFDLLVQNIKQEYEKLIKNSSIDKTEFFNYAANRWYNFHSAMAMEEIFCTSPKITAAKNSKDRLVDFSINEITFDHKTSVFPKGFGYNLDYAMGNKPKLIKWFYDNQSQQQRKHLDNRLFIVVHSATGKHWKLKAEIEWLKNIVIDYATNFNQNNLISLELKNNGD
ncbi:MAG: hypothetical protein V3V16_04430, partial [Melioribacteraceae bacterium]